MPATKLERIVLYGAVPIAAAIIGAVVTAFLTREGGDAHTAASIAQVAADRTMSAAEKLKALELINKNDQQFYSMFSPACSRWSFRSELSHTPWRTGFGRDSPPRHPMPGCGAFAP